MNKTKKLVIFGTGEIGRMAHFYFTHDSDYEVVAFTADDEFVTDNTYLGLPLLPFSRIKQHYPPNLYEMHVGLSFMRLNQTRAEKYYLAKKAGYTLASYVCSKSAYWPDLTIGDNCFILENQTIQPTVKIGSNVMLWSGNHLGHGSIIRDHVYFASHICMSGFCDIGERTFIGVNATLRDFCKVGSDCFITMDTSVVTDVPSGSVVLADRAKVLTADDPVAQKIKNKYFFATQPVHA
ncbi:MAG: hypothetical protein A3E82_00710 [Gammaproteobacteria bacterium RIFCSPHIGHO2_12_FULL_38_11]|nr:MAG: hypothetical protein A3E82_00710 [Gammaproteobacteria bacterium RIFCSPHIGHO2_12_FULL_38_11]